ncbi:class I SAM-dependent methyltransferase [Candidatus Woesearchaeota archaeon]|jgi:ubiquinone/menaquinone biosynthesis C-methylase UbiE|nr:class I SAM-dependent methyltransferase [Candidatus Woesearchaeota archaeon]
MKTKLTKLVYEEFAGKNAQECYIKKAKEGLWISEKHFFKKYFVNKKSKLLDIGCGTGRTTIPLFKEGFGILGIDFVPEMIKNAKLIAKQKKLKIKYEVGDATSLKFKDNSFDYALFSNQGWTQIPGNANRFKALLEIKRVLKPKGKFIFTAHPRVVTGTYGWFWVKQWLKFHFGTLWGFKLDELDYGDRFFERETNDSQKTYMTKQYIHIPSIREVIFEIRKAGFKLIEYNGDLQISKKDVRTHPPVFFVCEK